jgi:drug/metabolite transporter (DMT)-like permease
LEEEMKRWMPFVICIGITLLLSGCAGGHFSENNPAGFWAGLWHGIILVIAFIVSLFNHNVKIYEPNNIGALYDLGFVLGIMLTGGGIFNIFKRR